jgi:cell division protein FtsQ
MNLLKSNDPAPSRLYYKINRLFYRLWFRSMLMIIFLVVSILLSKKFLYQDIDLNAEIRFLSEESSAIYKGLTELSITRILVKGAHETLRKEIITLVENASTKGFSALKAQALREKIEDIRKVKKAFVKFSTDGLVIVNVIERKEAVVFFNNDLYEVLDSSGVMLSIKQNYEGLSSFPLLVGKDASKNISALLALINEIGSYKSEVLYYEWVGERRWDIHMKSELVFKLPENNLNKGLEVMRMFLHETNKLSKTVVSVDLRNIHKPIIRFRKAPPVEYIQKNTRRLAG